MLQIVLLEVRTTNYTVFTAAVLNFLQDLNFFLLLLVTVQCIHSSHKNTKTVLFQLYIELTATYQ